jgi:hypothetical protein
LLHAVFVPDAEQVTRRVAQYWRWFAIVVFLLIPVDMLMTLLGQAAVGTAGEANPLMRWALEQGIATLVIVNIVAASLAVGVIHALLWLVPWMGPEVRPYFGVMLESWIGLGLTTGLWLFLNNLTVVLFRENLLLNALGQVLALVPA